MADKTLTPTASYIDNQSVQGKAAGWTHHLVFDYTAFSTTNLGTAADNDTATAAVGVNAGDSIHNAAVYLETAFTDSGSGDELDIHVGDDTEKDNFIALADIHDAQTEITYVMNTGASLDNENGKIYTAADNVEIRFTPNNATGTDYTLNELTAGKVHVYLEIRKLV